jgi:DNA polymerase I-like protein with 3'-5' exonuclease and polymerase domains
MNAGIQGLAADIFKVALVRLDAALEAGAAPAG